MAEIRVTRVVEQGQTKIRNVPIAVTPEGFWCCPSPVVFQKTLKPQNPLNKPNNKPTSPPPHKKKPNPNPNPNPMSEKRPPFNPPRPAVGESTDTPPPERAPKPPRKVAIEFGEPGSSDTRVVLLGKQGFCVKLSVHRDVLSEHSPYFADRISGGDSGLEIGDCEDVEIYVETVGLMYCKEMKQRLVKQSVSRVLRILKVAEVLGFRSCMEACLEYLEAVPWVGEEEEEKVISSVTRLRGGEGTGVLKRVACEASGESTETLGQIMGLVLGSSDERSRREMKSVVLRLLREETHTAHEHTVYASSRRCLHSLLSLFKQAAHRPPESKDGVGHSVRTMPEPAKRISFESDNLSWLLEILAERRAADEFAAMWAGQAELAELHGGIPVAARYHVSAVTARLFVGIGRGELLPSKETRQALLLTWLQPLIDDYAWLQNGSRPFDRKVVEEGIGRTILTLPLEDQQKILLSWLGSFLRAGDSCPNLQRAFEVWWRRTFVRPYGDNTTATQWNPLQPDES